MPPCALTINEVEAIASASTLTIRVSGTATPNCAEVVVRLTCVGGSSISPPVAVDGDGSWSTDFAGSTLPGCTCYGRYAVEAWCGKKPDAQNPCTAKKVGNVTCDPAHECPGVTINATD